MSPMKPSSAEEDFFAREELEKKRKLALQEAKAVAEEERKKLRELHYMRCPKCGMQLREIVYRGVAIDKCFSCNGVYLDDGELEKLAGEEGRFSKMFAFFAGND